MANESPPVWSSDVRISVPQPPESPILVPMYGFGFTQWGLAHDLTDSEYEFLRTPTYAPERPTNDIVHDDAHLDR